jgi:hypothetical protein
MGHVSASLFLGPGNPEVIPETRRQGRHTKESAHLTRSKQILNQTSETLSLSLSLSHTLSLSLPLSLL